MEVKFLGKGKNRLTLELVGETHTLANAVISQMWDDAKVDSATYEKMHPYLGNPIIVVESENADPVDSVKKACKKLSSTVKSVRTDFSKAIK